jgi:hypothetical protein
VSLHRLALDLVADARRSGIHIGDDLWNWLHTDFTNGLFDEGLRLIDKRTRLTVRAKGQQLSGYVFTMKDRILVYKDRALDFASRRGLPPPSRWPDASKGLSQPSPWPEELKPGPTVGTCWFDRPRGMSDPNRRPEEELPPASRAMVDETRRRGRCGCKSAEYQTVAKGGTAPIGTEGLLGQRKLHSGARAGRAV